MIGGGWLARSYFEQAKLTEEDKAVWKTRAINYNKELDAAFNKGDETTYKELLHPKVTLFMPRIPYRIDGAGEVMKKTKTKMEMPGSSITPIQSSAELYSEVLLVTYNFISDTKLGEHLLEGSGKVTRVWVHTADGWQLIHEHISSN